MSVLWEGFQRNGNVMKDAMRVIAFEPDEREFHKLKSTDKVIYLNNILFDKSRDVSFHVSSESGKTSDL